MPRKASRAPFYSQALQSWCIPLSNAVISLVDEDVANSLGWIAWSASSCGTQWRALRRPWINREYVTFYLHREIANVGDNYLIDHREHPPFQERLIDNRRDNLRICESLDNQRNMRLAKNNTSGFKGVVLRSDTGRWAAQLSLNLKHLTLGCYDTAEEAARAYDAGAILHFGEFALTNAKLGLLD